MTAKISLKLQHVFRFIIHNNTYLYCAIIFLTLAIRVINLTNYVWFQSGYDESRDMLVAKHIVEYGEWLWRGPYAAGGGGQLLNSPIYYYFLSILWYISRTPEALMIVWTLLFSTIPLLIYKITTNILDRRAGLIAALIAIVHPELIFISHQIQQPYLIAIVLSATCAILTSPKQTLSKFITVVLIIFLGLNFHYSILISTPVIAIWLIYNYLHQFKPTTLSTTILGITTLFCIELFFVLTYKSFLFDQLTFVKSLHIVDPLRLMTVTTDYVSLLWEANPNEQFFFFLISIISLVLSTLNKFNALAKLRYTGILGALVSSIVICSLNKQVINTYLIGILPLGIIITAITLRWFYNINIKFGFLITALIILFFSHQTYTRLIQEPPKASYYEQTKQLAHLIYKDNGAQMKNTDIEFLWADVNQPLDNWQTSSIYFTLEELYKHKLITLHDSGINFSPIQTNITRYYIVCDQRVISFNTTSNRSCFDWFQIAIKRIQHTTYSLIYSDASYSLWRVSL